MNLIVLSSFFFFTYTQQQGAAHVMQSITVGISTGLSFLQFCGTVLYVVIAAWCCQGLKPIPYVENKVNDNIVDHRAEPVLSDACSAGGYHDSIFNESEPLLPSY